MPFLLFTKWVKQTQFEFPPLVRFSGVQGVFSDKSLEAFQETQFDNGKVQLGKHLKSQLVFLTEIVSTVY